MLVMQHAMRRLRARRNYTRHKRKFSAFGLHRPMTQSLTYMRDRSDDQVPPNPNAFPPSCEFLGMRFEPLSMEQTVERAASVSIYDNFRYIVTPNVDIVVNRHKYPSDYKEAFEAAWISICDSRILELLGNLSGLPLKAVPGSTLTERLFETVITPDTPVTMIGGDEATMKKVQERYGLKAVNIHIPPMGLRTNPDARAIAAEFVAQNPARFVFFCVGAPQGEMLAKACADRGDCKGIGFSVGASLDFLAGKQSRAPEWMQKARMEWLYRLLSEPRRLWKRYLLDGPKVFPIYFKWILRRKAR